MGKGSYSSDMTTTVLEESLRFHRACLVNCQQLDAFLKTSVQPILERKVDPLPYRRVCLTLELRVQAWLGSLCKMDTPGDFQAASAACRSLFETAIDMVLIFHQEGQSVKKLLAWQRSNKLKYAKRLNTFAPEENITRFIQDNEQDIRRERAQTWGTDRNGKPLVPDRWTGRNLEQDAEAAERYLSAGFKRFYAERYASTCWYVHGSGVLGILEFPAESFPDLCAIAMHNACNFGMICGEYALRLYDEFDDVSQQRLQALKEQMGRTALTIWKPPGAAHP